MLRRGSLTLVSLVALVAMLVLPGTFTSEAAPSPCADISFILSYTGPSGLVEIPDDNNTKFGVPVGIPLTFTIEVDTDARPALVDKQIVFKSPNQFLQLIEPPLGANSISDDGEFKYNIPSTRQNVNFEVKWPKGDETGDDLVSFQAMIHPDNLVKGPIPGQLGELMTLTAQVAQGRCTAKLEIRGTPGGGGPGPQPCPGIDVQIEYEASDGNFYPVIEIFQGPGNSQFEGPGVGGQVRYTITPLGGPIDFTVKLHQTDTFNRQFIDTATTTDVGSTPFKQNNASPPNKALFDKVVPGWDGGTKVVTTTALTRGLDTVTFISRFQSSTGPVNSLCSTHKEVRIAASPLAPPD